MERVLDEQRDDLADAAAVQVAATGNINAMPRGPGAEGTHHRIDDYAVTPAQRALLPNPSLSAEKHWTEKVHENLDTAKRATGFSFAPKATQERDLAAIRAYVTAHNDASTRDDALPKNVSHATDEVGRQTKFTVTHLIGHDGALLPHGSDASLVKRTEKRTYSTHEGHGQLYPLEGDGVAHGVGAADMIAALNDAGIDLGTSARSNLAALASQQQSNPNWVEEQLGASSERKEKREKNREDRIERRTTGALREKPISEKQRAIAAKLAAKAAAKLDKHKTDLKK